MNNTVTSQSKSNVLNLVLRPTVVDIESVLELQQKIERTAQKTLEKNMGKIPAFFKEPTPQPANKSAANLFSPQGPRLFSIPSNSAPTFDLNNGPKFR